MLAEKNLKNICRFSLHNKVLFKFYDLLPREFAELWNKILINKFFTPQVENYVPRPLSCEGPSDSGVSVSSEYICPDGDTSSITAQSQTVSGQ